LELRVLNFERAESCQLKSWWGLDELLMELRNVMVSGGLMVWKVLL
jgi:hypothetical protein